MILRARRLTAPLFLRAFAAVLRTRALPPGAALKAWEICNRYVAFLDVPGRARIANGMVMRVRSNPRVENEIFLLGEWEPHLTRRLLGRGRTDGVFLDIGANIGYFSLIASSVFSEVHAIEASPSTAARLSRNLAENGVGNVTVHNIAVGPEVGTVRFYRHRGQSGASSVFGGEGKAPEDVVPVAPLARILEGLDWGRVKFVKIDVEGSEACVLRELLGLADELPQDVEIFTEYDPANRETWPLVRAFLDRGFSARLVQGPYDRRSYVERRGEAPLTPLADEPGVFCDILLKR